MAFPGERIDTNYGILYTLPKGEMGPQDFSILYSGFQAPITALDCGDHCAPYNDRGVPFCCDIQHAVPAAYDAEWEYLQENTDLWSLWRGESPSSQERLASRVPEGKTLIACKGYAHCIRGFRSLACRSFPFFPYITRQGKMLGLSYYWEYEDRCWVISNLHSVSPEYLTQFITTFDQIFEMMPEELELYRAFSSTMRRVFGRKRRAIPVLHRNGAIFKITPHNGRMRRIAASRLPKFGYYKVAAGMPFPDERVEILNPAHG